MKSRRTALRVLLITVISLVIGLSVYSINAKMAGNPMPMPFGTGMSVILSGSMEPALSVNDFVIIRRSETYETGDIVVFPDRGSLVIHRIKDIFEDPDRGTMILTRGDANDTDDDPVPMDSVKGRLALRIPFAGVIVNAVKSLPGVIIILGTAIFLMIRSYGKEKEQGQDELDKIREEIEKLRSGSGDAGEEGGEAKEPPEGGAGDVSGIKSKKDSNQV